MLVQVHAIWEPGPDTVQRVPHVWGGEPSCELVPGPRA